jgi:SAM-dependent methyltransferase
MMSLVEAADRAERKRRGAWYTPPALAELLVRQAVTPALDDAAGQATVRVLDPACGDGRLLAAAAEAAARARVPSGGLELVGIELDPHTAQQARLAVPGAEILVGDGREIDPGGRFDAVIGNPPYLGQLARVTSRGGSSRLGGGPYADVAAEFLLRAVQLARPVGGRVALVLPQSVLVTRDTEAIRAAVLRGAAVTGLWWAGSQVFEAGVHVCVVVLQRGRAQRSVARWRGPAMSSLDDAPARALEGATWAPLIADAAGVPAVDLPDGNGRLGDLATASAGFRQHFYGLAPFVRDDGPGPPLVTTGLIDVGHCAWGERPARFAKRRFTAPRVDLDALASSDVALAGWARGQLRPKVLVASQTRVIEAAVDEAGAWIPSVPVVSVQPRRVEDLWLVAAVLLAPPVAAWAAHRHLGSGLGPTSLRLRASELLDLPLPTAPWTDAAVLLRAGQVDAAAVELCTAYGLGGSERERVLSWWRAAR